MHLRVQEVSNFLAVGVLGSGSVRLTRYRGLRARAFCPIFWCNYLHQWPVSLI
jgi:hypothetical protein